MKWTNFALDTITRNHNKQCISSKNWRLSCFSLYFDNQEKLCIFYHSLLLRSHVIDSFCRNTFIINMWLSRLLFMVSSIFSCGGWEIMQKCLHIEMTKWAEERNLALLFLYPTNIVKWSVPFKLIIYIIHIYLFYIWFTND